MSGDVHHAQFLGSKCNPFKGFGPELFEITTSGITHTCDKNIFGLCKGFLNLISPRTWYLQEPVIEYNYAIFKIENNKVNIEIKGKKVYQTI